jgi:hypothetical protein
MQGYGMAFGLGLVAGMRSMISASAAVVASARAPAPAGMKAPRVRPSAAAQVRAGWPSARRAAGP